MKRRVRTQPSNPFYSDEPAVSKAAIADKPPVPSASLANKPSKPIDKNPGKMSGVAGFVDKHRLHGRPMTPVTSNVPQMGKLRLSGHSGAHRIGGKKV